MAQSKAKPNEFDLIARYFAPLASAPGAFGLGDDAAILPRLRQQSWVVTTDALVEGVHFLAHDPIDTVAQKLLRVNLSDLAAKGARPLGYVLTTAFGHRVDAAHVARFARGLARDQAQYSIALFGGDTVATPGPAMFSCTAFGVVGRKGMIRRNGARVGDHVWVTGTIGDAGLGLKVAQGALAGSAERMQQAVLRRYRLPEPRIAFGLGLAALAHAALDVSDGLVQDVGHLARESGVGIALELFAIPLSKPLRALTGEGDEARRSAVAAGDDYEIVFTAAPRSEGAIVELAAQCGHEVTRIGRVVAGGEVVVLDAHGAPIALSRRGYTHF